MSDQKRMMRYGHSAESPFAAVYEAKRTHDETRARLYRALAAWTQGTLTIEDLRSHFLSLKNSVKLLVEHVEQVNAHREMTPPPALKHLHRVDAVPSRKPLQVWPPQRSGNS
jgi:hypothetical protein